MIALDQMGGDRLPVDAVADAMSAPDAALREAAGWIAARHPEWGEALAAVFRERLADEALSDSERRDLEGQLARLATNEAIQRLVAEVTNDESASIPARLSSLRAMAASSLKAVPDAWVRALAGVMAEPDAPLVSQGVAAATQTAVSKVAPTQVVLAKVAKLSTGG